MILTVTGHIKSIKSDICRAVCSRYMKQFISNGAAIQLPLMK